MVISRWLVLLCSFQSNVLIGINDWSISTFLVEKSASSSSFRCCFPHIMDQFHFKNLGLCEWRRGGGEGGVNHMWATNRCVPNLNGTTRFKWLTEDDSHECFALLTDGWSKGTLLFKGVIGRDETNLDGIKTATNSWKWNKNEWKMAFKLSWSPSILFDKYFRMIYSAVHSI